MKVPVISLNAKYVHLSPAPYALGAGVLAFARYPHEVIPLPRVVGKEREALLATVVGMEPDAVALSVYIWNIEEIKRLLPRLRAALPSIPIILGGPEVSYVVEKTLREMPEADYVLSGEGEEPFARLLDVLAEGGDIASVPGCGYRTEDGVFVPAPFIGKGTPPSPLDFGYAEALHGRIAYLEGSRGCPFSCAFCLSGRADGVRFFDIPRVKRDLLRLAEADTRTVKLVDRTFNADRARARELWAFLLQKRQSGEIREDVCFHFEIAGELLDEETLALLSTAPKGLFQMEIGLQSFHAPTLRAIRRAPVSERLCENISRLVQMGNIHVHIDLIAGLPLEDHKSFREGFDRAFSLGAHMLQLGFLKLLHGAPLREEPEKYPCTYDECAPYTVRETPALPEAALVDIALCEEGCERLYNSGKYRGTTRAAIACGVSPYTLFRNAGARLNTLPQGYTQDEEIALLLAFFSDILTPARARDLLLLDFLSTNPSCYTPKALRVKNPLFSRVKRALDARFPHTARRALAFLYTENCIAYADYDRRDPITGEYPVTRLEMKEFIAEL